MATKKIPIGFNPAEAELEQRVEAMMEPVRIKVVDHTDGSTEAAPAAAGPLLRDGERAVGVKLRGQASVGRLARA